MGMDAARIQKLMGVGFILLGVLGLAMQMRGEARQATAAAIPQAMQGGTPSSEAPQFQDAHVEKREVRGTLADDVRRWASETTTARWLGYSVTEMEGDRTICCENWNGGRECGTCRLEGGEHGININEQQPQKGTVKLESSRKLAILYRAENGKVGKIRIFSADCSIDAGGRDVLWLGGVKDSESVALLTGYVTAEKADRENESLGKSALTALAVHHDSSAERALEDVSTSSTRGRFFASQPRHCASDCGWT